MLALCWRYFSLLGASWPHFSHLAAFVVALGRFLYGLGRSGLNFRGFWEGPGRVLKAPGRYFSKFFGACKLAMRNIVECAKTIVFPRFLYGFYISQAFRASQEKIQNRPRS